MSALGKAFREGISLFELMDLFPDEEAAVRWFEAIYWSNAKPMPYWCSDCRSYFSVLTGSAVQSSKIPLRKWQ